jgi:uncharacterized coiled-coil protein SlyX
MMELLDRMEAMESRQATTERRLAFWWGAALMFATVALLLLSLRSVTAQSGGSQAGGLPALTQRVTTLEGTVATQGGQIAALQNTVSTQANQISELQSKLSAQGNQVAALQNSAENQGNQIGAIQANLGQEIADRQSADTQLQNRLSNETTDRKSGDGDLEAQIKPLTDLFLAPNGVNGQPFFSRQGGDVFITGANLHIVNGLGATNGNPSDPFATVVNSLGNLIVGYNELRGDGTDNRTGSHNLVAGALQNYSSYGGLIAGFNNEISGIFASVTGGNQNTASGNSASVSGGAGNTASGTQSSVSGGVFNSATGTAASVSGGRVNTAGGDYSAVSGGDVINATQASSWAAGGGFEGTPGGGAGVFHSP